MFDGVTVLCLIRIWIMFDGKASVSL